MELKGKSIEELTDYEFVMELVGATMSLMKEQNKSGELEGFQKLWKHIILSEIKRRFA